LGAKDGSVSEMICGNRSKMLHRNSDGECSFSEGSSSATTNNHLPHAADNHLPNLSHYASHTDWVRDVADISLDDGQTSLALASVSNDKSMILWSRERHIDDNSEISHSLVPQYQFKVHRDYVNGIVYGNKSRVIYTCGMDGFVFGWDLRSLGMSSEQTNEKPYIAIPRKCLATAICVGHTVNSIDLDSSGGSTHDSERLIVTASTDCIVRLYDTRQARCERHHAATRVTSSVMDWRGHKDNVKCVKFSTCGRYVFSCSSDRSIKKWDLRKRRCLSSFYLHNDTVLKLHVDESLPSSHLLSFGRDGQVVYLDTETKRYSSILKRDEPVYCGTLSEPPHSQHLWIGTDSGLYRYPFKRRIDESEMLSIQSPVSGSFSLSSSIHSPTTSFKFPAGSFGGRAPGTPFEASNQQHHSMPESPHSDESYSAEYVPTPDLSFSAPPRIIKHSTLNDKRSILTQDNEGNVTLFDVTKGGLIKHYGKHVDYDRLLEQINPKQSIPSWFSVSITRGHPEILLTSQQAFAATAYITDAQLENLDLSAVSPMLKINYGEILLRNTFLKWLRDRIRINTEEKHRYILERKKKIEEQRAKQSENTVHHAEDVGERMEDDEEYASSQKQEDSISMRSTDSEDSVNDARMFYSDLANGDVFRKQYDETIIRFFIDEHNTRFTVNYDMCSNLVESARPSFMFTIASLDPLSIFEYRDIPEWIVDTLMEGAIEKVNKINLHLEPKDDKFIVKPYTKSYQNSLSGSRLSRIQTVCEHLGKNTHLPLKKGAASGGIFGRGGLFGASPASTPNKDDEVPATEYIQIFAADNMETPLDVNMTLAVANQFHRNKNGPFTLYYGKNPKFSG